MLRKFLPVLYIVAAVGLYFVYIQPAYSSITQLQAEEQEFDDALAQAEQLQQLRNELMSQYNSYSAEDLDRLATMLPNSIDTVQLILDIDGIVRNQDMLMRGIAINIPRPNQQGRGQGMYRTMQIEFTTTGTYEDLLALMDNLEQSLRLVDLESLSFSPQDSDIAGAAVGELTEYQITLSTYWLDDSSSSSANSSQ